MKAGGLMRTPRAIFSMRGSGSWNARSSALPTWAFFAQDIEGFLAAFQKVLESAAVRA